MADEYYAAFEERERERDVYMPKQKNVQNYTVRWPKQITKQYTPNDPTV